jgi:hypothetical protein
MTRDWSGTLPNPGLGPSVELLGSDTSRAFNLQMVGKGLAGQGFAPEESPPTFLQVEPTGTFGDRHLMHTRRVVEPGPHLRTSVTG